MRLCTTKTKNDIFFYVLESKREGEKIISRVAYKIGKYSDLIKKHEDPYKYAQEFVDKLNNELKDNKLTYSKTVDFSKKLEGESIISSTTALNVGWLYLNQIYKKLDIDSFYKNIDGKFKFNLANIVKYLVSARILKPNSKLQDFNNIGTYFGINKYQLQESYRSLKIIGDHSEELQSHLFKKVKDIIKLDTQVLFYDCTNFYTETENQDEDILDEDGNIVQWGLRKYGFSKEHRPNPIVQMGLFTDKNGIPLSYVINPGNTNEQVTTIPLEQRMLRDYKTSKFIYCSDGGLGSFENRFFNTLQNRDYIVTQSLKKTNKSELDLMLKDLNWRFVCDDKEVSLNKFKEICNKVIEGKELTLEEKEMIQKDMIYKKYPMRRKIDPSKILNRKASGNIEFEETIFLTFSAKYYFYQSNVFDKQLLRAQNWLEKGIEKRRNPNDISRLIRTMNVTKNGELADEQIKYINQDQVELETIFHGFYAAATSLDTNIKEILSINSARWKIEYQFRIMKSEFDSRPIYVSSNDSILGHFAICYIAIFVYSILESLVKKQNDQLTTSSIIKTLRNLEVINQEYFYQPIYTNSLTLQTLESIFNLDLDRKYLKEKNLLKLI